METGTEVAKETGAEGKEAETEAVWATEREQQEWRRKRKRTV